MHPNFKPLLGKDIDFQLARWPMFMSTKLDGIRCLIIDGVAMSRSLKPIPNAYVQKMLGHAALNGLDGELIVGAANDPNVYLNTYSGVMKGDGEPDFTFWVFDDFTNPRDEFEVRDVAAATRINDLIDDFPHLRMLQQYHMSHKGALDLYERFLAEGYEGAMFRSPNGLYKFGRSTAKCNTLLKWKPLIEFDAIVTGYYEKMHNGNEAYIDELGHTARTSHKENKTGRGTLGGLNARAVNEAGEPVGPEFSVGIFKGLKALDLWDLWAERETLPGRLFKCVKLGIGEKDRPRHPRWTGWRANIDTSAC